MIPLCAVTGSIRGKLGIRHVSAGRWVQKIFGSIIFSIGGCIAIRFWGINLW